MGIGPIQTKQTSDAFNFIESYIINYLSNNSNVKLSDIQNNIKIMTQLPVKIIIERIKLIYNSEKFVESIRILSNDIKILSNDIKITNEIFNSDLYKLLEISNNLSYNELEYSFQSYLEKLQNNNNYFATNIIKIIIGYCIILNQNTKKIYDKYYWIRKIKNNGMCNFLSTFTKMFHDFNFDSDLNSDEFDKVIKLIFLSDSRKKLTSFPSDNYIFDEEFINYNSIETKLKNFLDLYKFLELNIDMNTSQIKKKFDSLKKKNKINKETNIEKYIGYNILMKNKTKKIYDNYYLDFHIEIFSLSNDYLFEKNHQNNILKQIDNVYSILYNPDTKLSCEKLTCSQIDNLINNYNEECDNFLIKLKKTPEEIINLQNNIGSNNHNKYFYKNLDKEFKRTINSRDIFYKQINLNDTELNKILSSIIKKYNEITCNELCEYMHYLNNNIVPSSFIISEQNQLKFDEFCQDHKLLEKINNFSIDDFTSWKKSYIKQNEKITDCDYNNYVENRKKYDSEIEKMYLNNLNLIEYQMKNNMDIK